MEPPILETPRLQLRPWQLGDEKDIFEYSSDPTIARDALWPPHTKIDEARRTIEEAQARYAKEGWLYWGIIERDSGKLIGSAGLPLLRRSDNNAELGYALNRRYWGRGFATEACRGIIEYAWSQLKLHRIEAKCLSTNVASIHVLQKLGFGLEGCRKEAAFLGSHYGDIEIYALLEHAST